MAILVIRNGKVGVMQNETQLNGEKIPGDLNSWQQFSTDPNIILKYSYGLLSERSATLYHTHPPVAAAIEKHTEYAIGPGLVFRSQPDWTILGMTKERAKEWGMLFQKLVHYAFLMLNYYEKQPVIFRTGLIQGDSLLLFDRKEPVEGLPFDLIETGGDQINWERADDLTGGQRVILGVQTDALLRRKGLYLINSTSPVPFQDENGFQNIIQFFEKKIARQLRGYPLAYRMIAAAKNNDRYWDAILNRAALEATILGIETSDNADVRAQMERLAEEMRLNKKDHDATTTGTDTRLTAEGSITALGSGNILSLAAKGEFKFLEMKTPSNNFDKFQEAYLHMVGMGMDTPPEVVKSMYSTSYTAHKGAFNDFIKSYMKKRSSFIKAVNFPIIRELAKYFITARILPIPHDRFFIDPIIQYAALSGNWLGPVPGTINPLQEVNAKEKEVQNAFMLRSDAAADYGNEFDNIIEQWGQEEEEWSKRSPEYKAAALDAEMKAAAEKAADGGDNSNDNSNDDGGAQ
jgi:capsid protein